MSWARLDDRFHGNPKVMRAWRSSPAAVGLYVMGITYCAQHETDGFIDEGFVLLLSPAQRERDKLTGALVECGLWHVVDGGWAVNGYLEFNPSRADLEEKRRKDSERKARGRNSDSRRNPDGVRAESARPDPTRPVHPPTEDDGRPGALPADLPATLAATATATHTRLTRVAAAKKAKAPTLAATGRVVADFPDHDHQRLAGEFEHYWVHGAGAKVVRKDIVLTYRRRLEHVTPGTGPQARQGESLHDLAARANAAHGAAA